MSNNSNYSNNRNSNNYSKNSNSNNNKTIVIKV